MGQRLDDAIGGAFALLLLAILFCAAVIFAGLAWRITIAPLLEALFP